MPYGRAIGVAGKVGAGLRFNEERATLSVNVQNVLDDDILQHVFGDIIPRKITARLLFRF